MWSSLLYAAVTKEQPSERRRGLSTFAIRKLQKLEGLEIIATKLYSA